MNQPIYQTRVGPSIEKPVYYEQPVIQEHIRTQVERPVIEKPVYIEKPVPYEQVRREVVYIPQIIEKPVIQEKEVIHEKQVVYENYVVPRELPAQVVGN
jgi:hypothetical protein